MYRLRLLIVIVGATYANFFCTASIADDKAAEMQFSRQAFGQSTLPLWTPLTEFELATLRDVSLAQAGDADALLAVYILAAGNHRDQDYYDTIKQQLDYWLNTQHKPLKRRRDIAVKARLLHDAMHRDFFLNDKQGDTLIGYNADQSQLPAVFTSKTFNCISSSLLYLVLARKLELPVAGVLLPSHAFVQLQTDDPNQPIEIETTSIYGFDTEHDEEFYQHADLTWFEERDLEPTTYDDYLQREIISAYELGLHNMWSQHTRPELMAYQDRMRLAEIRGYLQPNDPDAQKNRINFYLQELSYLNKQQDPASAARLANLIENYVNDLTQIVNQDEVLRSLQVSVATEIALAKISSGDVERGFQLAKNLLSSLDAQPMGAVDDTHFVDNLFVVISHYIVRAIEHLEFADVRLSMMGLENDCVASQACSQSLTQLYASWAQQFWDKKDWRNVSRILTDYAQLGINNQNSEVMRKNAESAYVNQAKELVWDGDWKTALNQLETCVDKLQGERKCSEQIRYINEQRHLGNL